MLRRAIFWKGHFMAKGFYKFYFTFGRSPSFPFQDGYVIVNAASKDEAIDKFREKYNDPNDEGINCSFIYNEDEWVRDNIQRHYTSPFCII